MSDLIERQAAIDEIEERKNANGYRNVAVISELNRLEGYIMRLPSAQPDALEQLEKVDTPTVDTPNCEDAVSREDVINMIDKRMKQLTQVNFGTRTFQDGIYDGYARIRSDMKSLPSAQPEMNLDEWCTDCKEYDHERHCCPRWNRVIRQTLKDAQPEIVRCKDCKYWREGTVYSYCDKLFGMGVLDAYDYMTDEDDYCSWAERRTDGSNVQDK